ncbi:hypothetical protein [Urbifossiella limnaea]|nr:hypothetical protein [Urbifossiella limnaea]
MSEQPTGPAPSGASPTASRAVELLVLLGIFVLWVVLQVWVLPKAGVPT